MKQLIQKFIDQIAETQGYDAAAIDCIMRVRGHGSPTVGPVATDSGIIQTLKHSEGKYPNLWYDTIGSQHVDFEFVLATGTEKVAIPKRLFSFQHAPFFGNCKMSIQRWVAIHDGKKWSDDLRAAAFKFRLGIASAAGTSLLVVSTGASSASYSAEVIDKFDHSYSDAGRTIAIVNVNKALKA